MHSDDTRDTTAGTGSVTEPRAGRGSRGGLVTVLVATVLIGCVPRVLPNPEALPLPVPSGAWVCGTKHLTPEYTPSLFVATDGSDTNDGRSEASPFRTMQRAASVVKPGDVVWVRGGTYSSDVVFEQSGTAEQPVVFESFPGECAVFDGSGLDEGRRLAFWNVHHVVFRNFEVRNSPAEGIFLSGANRMILSHIRTHHNHLSGILSMNGDENLFAFIVSHDNFDAPLGRDADGISIASGRRNRVSHCVVYRNSDDGVDTWQSTETLVERCIASENGRASGDGNGFKAGGGERVTNTIVRYSVAFDNRSDGFDWNSGRGVRFEYNTAFRNGRFGFLAGGAYLEGNIAYDNRVDDWRVDRGGNTEVANSWNVPGLRLEFESTDASTLGFLRPLRLEVAGSDRLGSEARAVLARGLGAVPSGGTLVSAFGVGWWADRDRVMVP